MFGMMEAMLSFLRRQIGLRSDNPDIHGSLSAKIKALGLLDFALTLNDGAKGAFNPTQDTTLNYAAHRFSNVYIPSGVTVSATSTSILIFSQGDVVIDGTLTASGKGARGAYENRDTSDTKNISNGGSGGSGIGTCGAGGGGGGGYRNYDDYGIGGKGGSCSFTSGGDGGTGRTSPDGNHGETIDSNALPTNVITELQKYCGAGGGAGGVAGKGYGGAGGAGGGNIIIFSQGQITGNGIICAEGLDGEDGRYYDEGEDVGAGGGGGGGGGLIFLVAKHINIATSVIGGSGGIGYESGQYYTAGSGGSGGSGLVFKITTG